MAKAHLLQAVCAVALLAASPALAQSNTPTGDTGAGGAPNTPTTHEAMPGNASMSAGSTAGPSGSPAPMTGHPMHGAAASSHHRTAMTHSSKSDNSQNSAVDQLNDRSFQAAQQGQAFGTTDGGTAAPAGSVTPSGKM